MQPPRRQSGLLKLARLALHPAGVAALAILVLGGCASNAGPPPAPPPVNVCAPVDLAPSHLAGQPGYAQFAVTVTDAANNPVTALKQSDFEARAASKSIPIQYFRNNYTGAPTALVIVVDDSTSMRTQLGSGESRIAGVRKALVVGTQGLNVCDEVAILELGGRESIAEYPSASTVEVIQPFTTDHALAMNRVGIKSPFGQTRLYDAIRQGLQMLEASDYSNRALLVITDGVDNSSVASKESVIAEARAGGIAILTVGIGEPPPPNASASAHSSELPTVSIGPFAFGGSGDSIDPDTLTELAAATGGRAYIVSSIDKNAGAALENSIAGVRAILGQSYAVGVVAPAGTNPDAVTVALANRPDSIASARRIQRGPAAPTTTAQNPPP